MRKQFCWHILAIILLCICLPFGLSDKNGQRNAGTSAEIETTSTAIGRNGKFRMPKPGLPLRDDSDYVRENERNDQHSNVDDDYDDDEYYDGEQNEPNKNNMKKKKSNKANDDNEEDENDVQQSPEIVEQAQSGRTQIIQRPKELTDAEIAALLHTAVAAAAAASQQQPGTPNADVTAPADPTTTTTSVTATELCPKECSCLNDFMTCTRPHLKHLPKVPQFIQSLYVTGVFFSLLSLLLFSHLIASQLVLLFLLPLFIRYFLVRFLWPFSNRFEPYFSFRFNSLFFFSIFFSHSNQIRISRILCNDRFPFIFIYIHFK